MNAPQEPKNRSVRMAVVAGLLLILLAVMLPRGGNDSESRKRANWTVIFNQQAGSAKRPRQVARPGGSAKATSTAEQIVWRHVSQFGRSRREICFGLARKHQVEVPAEVERFFDAVEAGNWDELESLFDSIWKRHQAKPPVAEIEAIWPAVLDAYGAAEQAHEWPAQKLLDYGNAILGSLRPDSVYVGGTDPGRFVPALLNGSEGEPRIVVTQNGLADPKYLEYVQFLYGDRFAALGPEDARTAQLEYLQDARKRLEQNQLRPGEDVRLKAGELQSGFEDDAVQASGQISVMAVNERLLNKLLEKNPNLSFALEESFPLKSVNADATPNGPIMELRAQEDNPFTPERASQSVEYWREQTKQLMADAEFMESDYAKKSYSKLVSTQAGLLADRNYQAEAEAAFQFANQLCPYCPEAIFRHVDLLLSQQRADDAARVLNNAIGADPKNQQFRDLAAQLQK